MSRILAYTLTYNPVDYVWVKAWAQSLLRFNPEIDVLIVDESPDPEAAARVAGLAHEAEPRVVVERIDADDRVKAYNLGFTRAQEGGYDYVLFCDSDTIVLPSAVRRLQRSLELNPRAGVVSAVMNTKNTAGWKHMTTGIPDGLVTVGDDEIYYEPLVAWFRKIEEQRSSANDPELPAFRDHVFMTDATFLLMRMGAVRDLAGFDPALRHIAFAEDFAQRLADKGWTWGACKNAVVYHGQRGLGGNMDGNARGADTSHMHGKWGDAAIEQLNQRVRACIYWGGWRDRDPLTCGEDDKEYWLYHNLKAFLGVGPP